MLIIVFFSFDCVQNLLKIRVRLHAHNDGLILGAVMIQQARLPAYELTDAVELAFADLAHQNAQIVALDFHGSVAEYDHQLFAVAFVAPPVAQVMRPGEAFRHSPVAPLHMQVERLRRMLALFRVGLPLRRMLALLQNSVYETVLRVMHSPAPPGRASNRRWPRPASLRNAQYGCARQTSQPSDAMNRAASSSSAPPPKGVPRLLRWRPGLPACPRHRPWP